MISRKIWEAEKFLNVHTVSYVLTAFIDVLVGTIITHSETRTKKLEKQA